MKKLLSAALFVFALCPFAFSQAADVNPKCPQFDVENEAGLIGPDGITTFTADVDTKGQNFPLEYIWSLNAGEILSGQNTNSITVKFTDVGSNLTATLEIKGVPEGCPIFDSETIIYCVGPSPILVDEFSINIQRIDKARLDYLFRELAENPNDQGYILEQFSRKTARGNWRQKLRKINDYIKIRGMDASRITIVHSFADENKTKIWRIPPGANNPEID